MDLEAERSRLYLAASAVHAKQCESKEAHSDHCNALHEFCDTFHKMEAEIRRLQSNPPKAAEPADPQERKPREWVLVNSAGRPVAIMGPFIKIGKEVRVCEVPPTPREEIKPAQAMELPEWFLNPESHPAFVDPAYDDYRAVLGWTRLYITMLKDLVNQLVAPPGAVEGKKEGEG